MLSAGTVNPYTTSLALMEAEYILCRDQGWERTNEKVEKMIQSRAVELVEEDNVPHEAARIKCDRSIALGDCHTIAPGPETQGNSSLRTPRGRPRKEMKRKHFPVKILFVEPSRKPH